MSIVRVAWAMQQTTGSASRKAVLIALADCENGETGRCCPKIETLAERLEMGKRTVQNALVALEGAGFITRTRSRREDGSLGVYQYQFAERETPETTSPAAAPAPGPAATDDITSGNSGRSRGTGSSSTGSDLEPGERVRASPTRIDGKPVRAWERLIAQEVLAAWNREAQQRLTEGAWLGKLVMRIREHPELTAYDHTAIIVANLADPWWTGPPTPSVVYGNAAQFERAMLATSQPPKGGQGALQVALEEQRRMRETG